MRNDVRRAIAAIAVVLAITTAPGARAQQTEFSWDRASIYYVSTAHFHNGDPGNDAAAPAPGFRATASSSHGGDFDGLKSKIEEGYFDRLGVDAICVSVPNPESALVSKGDTAFPLASYWPLAYPLVDARLGGEQAFASFVEAAHGAGLRVLFSTVLPARGTAIALDSSSVVSETASAQVDDSVKPEQVLKPIVGADRAAEEVESLKTFFDRTGLEVRTDFAVLKWISDWILRYGVDGLRVLNGEAVEARILHALKAEGQRSLDAWNEAQSGAAEPPERKLFFVLGEATNGDSADISAEPGAFDAVVRFSLTGSPTEIESNIERVGQAIETEDGRLPISYLSPDGAATDDVFSAGTELLLSPGIIQIDYGFEGGLSAAPSAGDQARRPDWERIDESVLGHWSTLGQFRKRHPAIAAGIYEKLSDEPYAFYRGLQEGGTMDEVIVVTGASGKVRLNVGRFFPNDTVFRDAYTGKISIVSYGQVSFQADKSGVLLLEPIE